jgi:hypothetical protein
MAYTKRYKLTQKLRSGIDQIVYIYEDGYIGDIKSYEATSISLEPNSSGDEPEAAIISSQLNVSFLISTEDDYDKLPDFLSYDDKKYYVELMLDTTLGESLKWRGYMFNDYSTIPFTTGAQQVDIICIDSISFMEYFIYQLPDNINSLQSLKTILINGLNFIGYPGFTSLFIACSYYADGMQDRDDGLQYEPFSQSYQYKRDFVGLNYYEIINSIVKSFGCRLFQKDGNWWLMSINEMAATTNYYTEYVINSGTYASSGTLDQTLTIKPYAEDDIYFVGNSQAKVIRKGYPSLTVKTPLKFADNYIHNSEFKQVVAGEATAWNKIVSGTGTVQLFQDSEEQLNIYRLVSGSSGFARLLSGLGFGDTTYRPYLYAPRAQLTFDAIVEGIGTGGIMDIFVIIQNSIGQEFSLNSSGAWQRRNILSPTAYININYSGDGNTWQSISQDIPLGNFRIGGTLYDVTGYIIIGFSSPAGGSNGGYIRNPKVVQNASAIEELIVTRTIGANSSLNKEIVSSLGLYKSTIINCYGALFNSTGTSWTNWYRYGHAAESFGSLPMLLARQYSNLLNKNYGTLEGDLGKTIYDESAYIKSLIYLHNTFLVQDSSTNTLSYSGKKFMANRLNINTYNDQVNSLQLIEISDEDNDSVEKITWVGDAGGYYETTL